VAVRRRGGMAQRPPPRLLDDAGDVAQD
jgi:hypothetical protein